MHIAKNVVVVFFAAVAFAAVAPARASLIILTGGLDASQVVAPVTDADGNVIGSTSTINGQPVSTSTATGFAAITIDTVLETITTDFSWSGLTGNADRAHLHDAPAGVTRLLSPPNDRFFHEVINVLVDENGNSIPGTSTVTDGFVPCGGTTVGDWDATADCAPASGDLHDVLQLTADRFDPTGQFGFTDFNALLTAFTTDGMFLDIHTQLYPGGEIRGQLSLANVPEPPTLTLLAFGLLGLLGQRRRRLAKAG